MATKKVSLSTLIIAIIITIFLMFVVYLKTDDLKGLSQNSEAELTILETYDRQRNQDVTITGDIRIESDYELRYTHMLETTKYGDIGLRSTTISLSSYAGEVEIQGTIVDVIDNELVVLNVFAVDVIQTDAEQLTGEEVGDSGVYNAAAGLYFPSAMFADYRILQSSAGTITLQNIQTQETVQLRYFTCRNDDSDADCSKLTNLFEQTAAKQFTTTDGVTYYKQSEVNSRFMSNDNIIGYFMNDANEADVTNISRYTIVPNQASIDTYLGSYIQDICKNSTYNLQTQENIDIVYENGKFIAEVTGLTNDETRAECLINIDFSHNQGGTLAAFDVSNEPIQGEADDTDNNQDDESDSDSDNNDDQANTAEVKFTYDPSVEQFPIDREKPFVFTSNRGHSIAFPSYNIAHAQVELEDDLSLSQMNCYAQQNIISSPNKEQLEINPTIQIFECGQSGEDIILGQQYIRIDLEDKVFFIKLLDNTRIDFANNISITAAE